jgi:acetate kinase
MSAAGGRLLVLNAGSSSIKCGLYDGASPRPAWRARVHADLRDDALMLTVAAAGEERVAELPRPGVAAWEAAIAIVLERAAALAAGPITAVGHRVVHGGGRFQRPVVVTPEILGELAAFESLAPLHQPQNVAGIRAAAAALPEAVQVACFDTAFHHTCPPVATRLAIPRQWHDRGIRRYGFHGLSYESVVARLPEVTGGIPARAVIAHLGAGASLCAVQDGRSIATTMGFTPLDGLVMATRCGSIDPGAVLHLVLREGLSPAAVETLLTRESGLLGVSGISGDMRVLLESGESSAAEAVELFCERAARETASLAAALGGLDAVVFTAGIGEHAPTIRARIAAKLAWLGLELDGEANARHGPRISVAQSRVAAWVIPTDEEGVIAAHVAQWRAETPACGEVRAFESPIF